MPRILVGYSAADFLAHTITFISILQIRPALLLNSATEHEWNL